MPVGCAQGCQLAVLAGVGELVGDRPVVDRDAARGAGEEAAAVADLEQVDDHVDRDSAIVTIGKPRERDVVFEREHREEPRPISLADAVLLASAKGEDWIATSDPDVLAVAETEEIETLVLPGQG